MIKELEAFGLIKRTCELYIRSKSYLIGSDIIENQISEALDTIKAVLQKQQELPEPFKTGVDIGVIKPKQYLKWEDLKFTYDEQKIKVKLNGENYTVVYFISPANYGRNGYEYVGILKEDDIVVYSINGYLYTANLLKQFFNNLHLEVIDNE